MPVATPLQAVSREQPRETHSLGRPYVARIEASASLCRPHRVVKLILLQMHGDPGGGAPNETIRSTTNSQQEANTWYRAKATPKKKTVRICDGCSPATCCDGSSPATHSATKSAASSSATVMMSTEEERARVTDQDLLAQVQAPPASPAQVEAHQGEAKADKRDFYDAFLEYATSTGSKSGTAKSYLKHLKPFFKCLKEEGSYDVQTQALNFDMSGDAPYVAILSPMEYLQVKKSEHISLGLACACKLAHNMCLQLLDSGRQPSTAAEESRFNAAVNRIESRLRGLKVQVKQSSKKASCATQQGQEERENLPDETWMQVDELLQLVQAYTKLPSQ